MRCEVMLPNHCQCANEAVVDGTICKLHEAFNKANIRTDETIQGANTPYQNKGVE